MADEYIAGRDEYLGLGSGAFSYLDGTLYASTFSIATYRQRIDGGRPGIVRARPLSDRERKRYYLLMRLFAGALDIARAEQQFGGTFRSGLPGELAFLEAVGAIAERGDRYELTEHGQYVWVALMREFFAALNKLRDAMRMSPSEITD